MWEVASTVKEAATDTVCLEDKIADAQAKAREEFLQTLRRIPTPDNEYMAEGRRFEQACYDGETELSPIIEGGCFQIAGSKEVEVDGEPYLMYGRLDVLKGGVIYDIKRVWKYAPQKFLGSYQHGFYLDLFPEATRFEYLIFDGRKCHVETYYRDQCRSTLQAIAEFQAWLKANGLWETYADKWACKR